MFRGAVVVRPVLTAIVNTEPIRANAGIPTVDRMDLKTAHLRLAAVLGLVGLARPVLSIAGAYESGPLGRPFGPLLLTALISVTWITAAVWRRVPNPVLTLAAAGVAYALFAILLNWSLQPFLASAETIPLPGYVAMVVFNALQGAVLGLVAWAIRKARTRHRDTAASR